MRFLLLILLVRVVGITDGDTVNVLDETNTQIKIRLHGIDCPEMGQDFGRKAKEFTSQFLSGKSVEVVKTDTDRYGRTVGFVIANGDTLNAELLKVGLAWHYKKYDNNQDWDRYEKDARAQKKGLWSQPNPIAPWDRRRG